MAVTYAFVGMRCREPLGDDVECALAIPVGVAAAQRPLEPLGEVRILDGEPLHITSKSE